MEDLRRATYRIPADAADYLENIARRNMTSMNAEVVRSVRERMERMNATTGEGFADTAPAVAPNEPALAGGPITHG